MVNTTTARVAEMEMPSEAVSRYLEAIYYIDAEGDVVRASRLAEWLGVSQATVAAALRRMVENRLVAISPGKEITLTAGGREIAAELVRRHRIAERWLTDVLGFDWLTADEEAARLEHALSGEVADRLYEMIGRPRTCPHGNPIPGAEPVPGDERSLMTLAPGETSRVRRVSEVAEHEVPDLLQFLGEQGFRLGVEVTAVEVSRGAGTMTVRVGDQDVAMSLDTAHKIWIDA
ncbi:MAG: metal-dependent transcriptional regulator [Dehalococcoidia bacterium]|nr:metal-dependent transcriptional regulator [Dehalococcoidia bacterium]